jgi:hypothetical protein
MYLAHCMLVITNLNVRRCIKINIFYNGFCKHGGKLHLYEHGHQIELQAFENVVQTPLDGFFYH